ncbi:hypothetical protein [Neobacillus sp. YIM B06451]|uniref:hypothetical protein n=1 Tax=Neobacillus sp. YIM B06451 TaxID=3070994 RepID=UPI00292FD3E3|nr:hypothetical protein [Neobacillus sp. YIM B06451]
MKASFHEGQQIVGGNFYSVLAVEEATGYLVCGMNRFESGGREENNLKFHVPYKVSIMFSI